MIALWDIAPCSLVAVDHIPEGYHLHTHRRQNLISHDVMNIHDHKWKGRVNKDTTEIIK
jgi:hypothetical protein